MRSCITIDVINANGLDLHIEDVMNLPVVDSAELIESSLENGKGVWYKREDGSVRVIGPEALRTAIVLIERKVWPADQAGS
jgi:hypothetical protein